MAMGRLQLHRMSPDERRGDSGVAHRNGCCGALRFFVALALFLTASVVQADQTTPYTPANASVVLQLVPPTTDPRVRRFNQLRNDFRQHPADMSKAVALALAYIDYGRSTGDSRFLGRAMAVIEPGMEQPEPPIPVLLVHATIQQSRHFFQASREELMQVLKRDPGNAQAWLTLATIGMVQGDDALANDACVHLANASSDFMGIVCTASLRSLTGHAAQAYALMSMVEDPGPKAPVAIRAWVEGLMADTAARMGKPDAADAHFKTALQMTPGDNFLLADYGEFLLDQGRPRDAINLVSGDIQSDTSFLVWVSAENALGLPRTRIDVAEMNARFQSMAQRGDHVFMREQSSYMLHVLHDPKAALDLAQQDWKVQRSPKDVRVYLEAALATHDPSAATPVLDFVARTHLDDVTINPLIAQLQEAPSIAAPVATSKPKGNGP
jgi:tetratricopeptide (TPR) repeat protein